MPVYLSGTDNVKLTPITSETRFQRAGAAVLIAPLLRDYGIDPLAVAQEIQFPVEIAELKPDTIVSLDNLLLYLDAAVRASGDPLFSFKLGARYRWATHGVIHRLTTSARCLRNALIDFCEYQRLYSNATSVHLHRFGADVVLGFGAYAGTPRFLSHLYALSAGVGYNLIHDLTGGAVRPLELHFSTDAPRNLKGLTALFPGCILRFNQSQTGVILAGDTIDWPLPGYDPVARLRFIAEIEQAYGGTPMRVKVQRLIRPQLLNEDPSMVGMARLLNIHPRSLRRALAKEGTTFEEIRDGVRNAIARELLEITRLSIGEISTILAFASHGSFVRAFERWNDMPPRAWRAQAAIN